MRYPYALRRLTLFGGLGWLGLAAAGCNFVFPYGGTGEQDQGPGRDRGSKKDGLLPLPDQNKPDAKADGTLLPPDTRGPDAPKKDSLPQDLVPLPTEATVTSPDGSGTCGNGTLQTGEICDGSNLAGESCGSQGFRAGGTLACKPGCKAFDTSACLWLFTAAGLDSARDAVHVRAMATDSAANTYLVGHFKGRLLLGTTTLSTPGDLDVFVAKVDSAGKFVWAEQAGKNAGDDEGHDVRVVGGDTYITGTYTRDATFGTLSHGSTSSKAGPHCFVARLNSAGTFAWVTAATASTDYGYCEARAIGASPLQAQVRVAGWFKDTVQFNSLITVQSREAAVVLRLDMATGSILHTTPTSSTSAGKNLRFYDLAVADSGETVAVGEHEGPVTSSNLNLPAPFGDADALILRFDTTLSLPPSVALAPGTSGRRSRAAAVALDSAGNLYVTGQFQEQISFGTAVLNGTATDTDLFLARQEYSTQKWSWAKQISCAGVDVGTSLALSSTDVYLAGTFSGAATLGANSLTALGGQDIFVAQAPLASGNFSWARSAGSPGVDDASALALDSAGTLLLAGEFSGSSLSVSLGGSGSYALSRQAMTDLFLWQVKR